MYIFLNHQLDESIYIYQDTVYIIDYKSDRNTTKEKLIQRYKNQQNAYYKVVKSSYKEK